MSNSPSKLPYPAGVTLLILKNAEPIKFKQTLLAISGGNYEVEQIADGQTVCIVKPGRKSEHDFQVLLCNSDKTTAWSISHKAILNDIKAKLKANPIVTAKFIDLLQDVCDGVEPDELLFKFSSLGEGLPGLSLEAILKVYKWIWGQEDCNYPPPQFKGRYMSMKGIWELK